MTKKITKAKNPKKAQNIELLKKAKMDDYEDEVKNEIEEEEKEIIYDFEENDQQGSEIDTSIGISEKKSKKSDDFTTLEKIDILRIDLLIFNILKQKAIEKNIEYVDIHKYITLEDLFPLKCSKKGVVKRIMFNIDQGYIKWQKINEEHNDIDFNINRIISMCRSRKLKTDGIIIDENGKKGINYDKYYETFLELKLTPEGLLRNDQINKEIKIELKNSSRLHKNIKIIQGYTNNLVGNYKATIGLLLTFVFALGMFYYKDNLNTGNGNMASLLGTPKQEQTINTNNFYFKALIDTLNQIPGLKYILGGINNLEKDIVEINRTINSITYRIKTYDGNSYEITIIDENGIFKATGYEKYIK